MKAGPSRGTCYIALLTAVCALLLSSACARKTERSVRDELAQRCALIIPAPGVETESAWNKWLSSRMANSLSYTPEQLSEAAETCLTSDLVLVLSHASGLPDDRETIISNYLSRGGRILMLGANHVLMSADNDDVRTWAGLNRPVYATTSGMFKVFGSINPIELSARMVTCIFPGQTGVGGEQAADSRWLPVTASLSATSEILGYSGSVYIHPHAEGLYSISGWLGVNPAKEEPDAFTELVEAALEAVSRDMYLHRYGTGGYSTRSQAPVQLSSRLIDRRRRDQSPVRLAVEWINRQNIEVRRHVSPPLDTLAMPAVLNLGLAPEATDQTELYTLRISIRDRNDQRSLDRTEQLFKVFPEKAPPPEKEPVTVLTGQLAQGRHPMFMLGVNYWPRLLGPLSRENRHWLSPALFDPVMVQGDLDQIAAAGINSIAIEYTEIAQAPQLLFVLDELRRRSMWAILYIPSLHPLDLRMDEALRLLEAVRLKDWNEVFALETARGIVVRPRVERRHLDQAWNDWVNEHFNSATEAEQKLGIELWRDRGRTSGPPDQQLEQGPHRNGAVALYYSFLRDYASRQMGYIRQTLRSKGYSNLLTARTAYAWPRNSSPGNFDALDLFTGAIHQDFMFVDAWTAHPLRSEHADGNILYAYARGMSGGKPVLWAEFGHHVDASGGSASLQRQKEVYKYFLDLFIEQGASGGFAWWFPPESSFRSDEDWGIVDPDGNWRQAEDVFRSARLRLRQTRAKTWSVNRQNATLIQSASQWREEQKVRRGFFPARPTSPVVTEWIPPGAGLDSMALLDPRQTKRWSEIEGLFMLNSEWGALSVAGVMQERLPGTNIRTYTRRPVDMEIINSGTVKWTRTPERQNGSIWLRVSQSGHADEWIPLPPLTTGARQNVRWLPRETGVWEIQPHMIGYGKFGERLHVEVTTPPQLF